MSSGNCNLCLTGRRRMKNVFTTEINGVTYCDMIMEISNIKLIKKGNKQFNACLGCTNKIKEFYDYKKLIERNNIQLKNKSVLITKPIYLDYLEEINSDVDTNENDYKSFDTSNKENITYYNGITIKKIEEVKVEVELNTNNLKAETNNNKTKTNNHEEDTNVQDENTDWIDSFDDTGGNENDIDSHSNESENDIDKQLNDDCDASVSVDDVPIFGELLKDFRDDPEDLDYVAPKEKSKRGRKKNPFKKKKIPKFHRKEREKVELKKVLVRPTFNQDLELVKLEREKRTKVNDTNKKKQPKSMCQYCGKLIFTSSIKEHQKIHFGEKEYQCDLCEKKYFTKAALSIHKKRHDNSLRKYKCDKCIGAFYSVCDLAKHMATHSQELVGFCKICKKGFKTETHLLRHEYRHDLSNKKVQCEECNKMFFDNVALRSHMRTHTGYRPYECRLCNIPYSFKHDFNRHCLKHHGIFFERRSEPYLDKDVMIREKQLVQQIRERTIDLSEPPFKGMFAVEAFRRLIKAVDENRVT